MLHFDRANIPRMTRTPEGYLRGEAVVTRTGVFLYENADGSTRKELRHPDDVLAADSLASLKMIPMTLGHPEAGVTAETAPGLSVGMTGETVTVDGRNVIVSMTITHKDAIAAIEKGTRELSLGYKLNLETEDGVWNGDSYGHRQRDVVYNHLAIVDVARAGRDARLNTDGASVLFKEEEVAMIKINVDGLSYDAAPEVGREVEKLREQARTHADSLATLQKKLDAADGALDAQKDATKQAQDALAAEKTANDSAAIAKRVAQRVDIETKARRLGVDAATDISALGDRAVMELAIKTKNKDAAFDGRSDDYVLSRFDQMIEGLGVANTDQAAALAPRINPVAAGDAMARADAAYRKSVDDMNSWRTKQ